MDGVAVMHKGHVLDAVVHKPESDHAAHGGVQAVNYVGRCSPGVLAGAELIGALA